MLIFQLWLFQDGGLCQSTEIAGKESAKNKMKKGFTTMKQESPKTFIHLFWLLHSSRRI